MAWSGKIIRSLVIINSTRRGIAMSSQRRAEEVLEKIKEKNPYYEKYAGKIAALQQTSPEEFLDRVEQVAKKKEQKKAAPASAQRNYSELLRPKEKLTDPVHDSQKKLSDVMKIELIEDKSAEEIKELWLEYHKTKDVIAAAIPVDQYEALMQKGKEHPIFLLPLPRNEGYEFIMLQFSGNDIHFTPLLCYQVHKENAPECLNLVHYPEMKDKGIILMRGEYDKQVLSGQEAQCLANQLQLYYCTNTPTKLALLETFTKQPDDFKHMDLIKELENIKLV